MQLAQCVYGHDPVLQAVIQVTLPRGKGCHADSPTEILLDVFLIITVVAEDLSQ